VIRPPRDEDAPGFAQRRGWVADVLEEPHQPDVVERAPAERERERVSLHECRVDPRSAEVSAGEFKLFRLDVDAEESDVRKFLTEDRKDGADSAADLEQPGSTLEIYAVAYQPLSQMLCLLDEPLLLARAVAVNVPGDGTRLGSAPRSASRPCR
jgi:hypothetical protein